MTIKTKDNYQIKRLWYEDKTFHMYTNFSTSLIVWTLIFVILCVGHTLYMLFLEHAKN